MLSNSNQYEYDINGIIFICNWILCVNNIDIKERKSQYNCTILAAQFSVTGSLT